MDHIVNHINKPNDLEELPKIYKTISGLKQNELNYYLLFIAQGNDLKEIVKFIIKKYYQNEAVVKIILNNKKISIISIGIKNSNNKIVRGVFYWEKESPFLYLLTDFGKERKLLENFIYKTYPLLERVSISSYQIINNLINGLLEEKYKIYSSMISEKTWWKEEEKFRPSLDYPKGIPIENVFKKLREKNSFINSIDLGIFNNQDLRVCRLFISRTGRLKYIDGSFSIFKGFILDKCLDLISENYSKLKNREQAGEKINPIIVNFNIEDTDPNTSIKEFIHILRENKNISLMTHHNGNPFFYADVTDVKEGSFFGVIFEAKDKYSKMILVPQEVSSPIALSKFLSHIFNRFGEGKITYQNG